MLARKEAAGHVPNSPYSRMKARVIQGFLEGRITILQFYAFVWDDGYENSAVKTISITALASRVRGIFGTMFRIGSSHGYVEAESRAGTFHRFEIH